MWGFNMTCIDYSQYDGPLPWERKPCTDPRKPWEHDVVGEDPAFYIFDRKTGKRYLRDDMTLEQGAKLVERLHDRFGARFTMRIK